MGEPIRIAMWSGPRNISTAMMRSFGNRPDAFVCDEPLYAHYLTARPEVDHPGRAEVIARHEADWRKVVAWLTGPVPGAKPVFYQKHMAHHLLPEIDRDWLDRVTNCFLIRDPAEMLTSLVRKTPNITIGDTGLPQQVAIFEHVRARTGRTPPVLDAQDVLENPEQALTLLCEAVGVPFMPEMLAWPPGRRETDGVWAKYWYESVEASTGFREYQRKAEDVPEELGELLEECSQCYGILHEQRLR